MKKLYLFELEKIFRRRLSAAVIVIVVLLTFLYGFSTYRNKYATDGVNQGSGREAVELDKAIAAEYEGILTDEKAARMLRELMPKSAPGGINAVYLYRNAMQSAVGAKFSDQNGNWNGLSVADVFGEEEIKIGYVDGWLGVSEDLVKVFTVLCVGIIVITAPVFSGEYGGVDSLILSGRYGRTKCAAAKALAGLTAAVAVTALAAACGLGTACVLYGREGLDCSILFAPLSAGVESVPYNITCGELILYQVLSAFAGALSAAGITLIFSALCRSSMTTAAASAAFWFLPVMAPVAETSPLFRITGLCPVYYPQFFSLMSVEQSGSRLPYVIWALPVSAVLAGAGYFASRRIFAGRGAA